MQPNFDAGVLVLCGFHCFAADGYRVCKHGLSAWLLRGVKVRYYAVMTRTADASFAKHPRSRILSACACLAMACGAQAVHSGMSVGAIGRDLAVNAQSAPQGAQICLWQ